MCNTYSRLLFSFLFSYSLLPRPFSSKQLRRGGGRQFLWNALMLAKFSKPDFLPPPLSWRLWIEKMQIWRWSSFYIEFPVYTIALLGGLHWCQNWKMHGERDSCSGSWSTIKQMDCAANGDNLAKRLVTTYDSPLQRFCWYCRRQKKLCFSNYRDTNFTGVVLGFFSFFLIVEGH